MMWWSRVGRGVMVQLCEFLISVHFVIGKMWIRVFNDIYDILVANFFFVRCRF